MTLVRPRLIIGAGLGATWGVVATLTHLAMFRGYLPAPTDSSLVIAVLLYLVRAPFIAALYLSTLIGRNSSSLVELVAEALVSGMIAGIVIAAALTASRRAGSTSASKPASTSLAAAREEETDLG